MVNKHPASEQLWEHFFGLVEGDALHDLRLHLDECSPCKVELERLRVGHSRLARAAVLTERAIPPFETPSDHAVVAPAKSGTDRHRVPWPMFATAAALLLAVALPLGWYSIEARQQEHGVRRTLESLAAISGKRELERETHLDRVRDHTARVRGDELRLQVHGPAELHVGKPHPLQIRATDLHGNPQSAVVTARLRDANDQLIFESPYTPLSSEGSTIVLTNLPLRSRDAVKLEVVARGHESNALRESIPVRGPNAITSLVINQQVYHPGEKVFFRSVTLDTLTLQPVSDPVTLQYVVTGPKNRVMVPVRGKTHVGGVGGGEFVIPPSFASGEYRIAVVEEGKSTPSVVRRFWVRRENEKLAVGHPREATPSLECFPEGGELVVGVPNRVYWRATHTTNKNASFRLLDSKNRELVAVKPAACLGQTAMGVMLVTPAEGETYRLVGDSVSHVLSPPRSDAIAMQIQPVVARADEPWVLTRPSAVGSRDLVVVVSCRGHVVFSQTVHSGDMRLMPPFELTGVFRITLMEVKNDKLEPIAERLVYRLPKRKLDLAVATNKGKYSHGERAMLTIKTSSGSQSPESAWLFARATASDARADLRTGESDLGTAQFWLGGDLEQAGDLEFLDLVASDDADAESHLELYLSTQGWRRIIPADSKEVLAVATPVMRMDNLAHADNRATMKVRQATIPLHQEWAARESHWDNELNEGRQSLESATAELDRMAMARSYAMTFISRMAGVGLMLLAAYVISRCIAEIVQLRPSSRIAWGYGGAAVLLAGILLFSPFESSSSRSSLSMKEALDQLAFRPSAGPLFRPTPANITSSLPTLHAIHTPRVHAFTQAVLVLDKSGAITVPSNGTTMPRVAIGTVGNGGKPPAVPLQPRQYAHLIAGQNVPESRHTVLWAPLLVAKDGSVSAHFDLPKKSGTWIVDVEGHTSSGLLGARRLTIETAP